MPYVDPPMTHGRKPRRPRPVKPNAAFLAMHGASKIAQNEAFKMVAESQAAANLLKKQQGDCAVHWRMLADTFNVVEQMSVMGICSDQNSRRILTSAQAALGSLLERYKETKNWTMTGSEISDIDEGIWLYSVQLKFVSVSEWLAARKKVRDKISAALAGNAGRGVTVHQL